MSSTIEQIDNYLRKNKKSLYANLNKWYGEKKSNGSFVLDDDAKNLKRIWEEAQNAKGINDKIAAFNTLKEELAHWTNPEELAKQEAELEGYGLDNWPEFADSQELDKLRFFDQLSITPETNKLDDLNVDEVYSQGYDYEQMKALADQYGYDYTDKSDRKEFLDKVYEYHKAKNVEDAFKANDLGGVAVDFMLPVSKEYAKNNYENINDISDMTLPLAADAVTNAAMMGYGTKAVANPLIKLGVNKATANIAANNVVAPVIREVAQMGLNDKSLKDAAIDAGGTIATNYATPYGLRTMYRWGGRFAPNEAKHGAQEMLNVAANKSREISNKISNGTPIVKIIEKSDGTKTPMYFRFNQNTKKLERVSDHVARNADNGKLINWDDYKEWQNISYANRDANIHKLSEKYKVDDEQRILTQMKEGAKKAKQNDIEGKPWNTGLNAIEAAGAANINPLESKMNWALNQPALNSVRNYVTNFQGQSKFATPMLNSITQAFGPLGEHLKVEKTKNLSEQELSELDMLQRMRDLHKKNPELFSAPKIPEKYKEFFDETKKEQWNSDTSIRKIFGGN